MEYSLKDFAGWLQWYINTSDLMPDMKGIYTDKHGRTQRDDKKHSKRPTPRALKDQIRISMESSRIDNENIITFEIGNEQMEANFPYYHILQQAPVIRKRNKGTTKSKGSQMYVKDTKKRDYEQVHWNGKTFVKEYSRNVRGSRINLSKTTMRFDNIFLNTEANQYLNMHYQYIDRICDEVANKLANFFGMKLGRKQDSGLIDEFAEQQGTSIENIIDIFGSFVE